ncbi:hypothetical protein [Sphingomonas sp. Leaf23]|uniref:hypothetical protein n=1 Tax=Sphingomonas sp. Leaf23 TaxID=1735689 RepID=UPI0012E0F3CB|nr:hypothetical protein [Sphingomonas sp. Leaf23]
MSSYYPKIIHPEYEYNAGDHVEIMGAISCGFMSRFLPEALLVEKYTIRYPYFCIPKEKMAAYIDMLMTPPSINLGLEFSPFAFPEEPEFEDYENFILAEPEYLAAQFEVHFEVSETAPLSWLSNYIDLALAARFLPLLKAHNGKLLAHAPHFRTFLNYVGDHADFAALLSQPGGPHRDLLRVHYDMIPKPISRN